MNIHMEVTLLTAPASFKDMENFAALAALTCHSNTEKKLVPHEILARIIKLGHESILEHITLTYSVKGLSRACLQELARHRHISLRKYLRDGEAIESLFQITPFTYHKEFRRFFDWAQNNPEMSNDELKYYLPEFWPTNLILTSNVRELRHILKLRTSPAALNEFRVLAYSLFEAVPESFRYLLEDCVYRENAHE